MDLPTGPDLLFSDGGCYNTADYGRQVPTIKLERGLDPKKYIVGVRSTTPKGPPWLLQEYDPQPKLLYTNKAFYVFNGEATDISQEFKGLPLICVQANSASGTAQKWVKEYSVYKKYPEVYLLLNSTCAGGASLDGSELAKIVHLANSGEH